MKFFLRLILSVTAGFALNGCNLEKSHSYPNEAFQPIDALSLGDKFSLAENYETLSNHEKSSVLQNNTLVILRVFDESISKTKQNNSFSQSFPVSYFMSASLNENSDIGFNISSLITDDQKFNQYQIFSISNPEKRKIVTSCAFQMNIIFAYWIQYMAKIDLQKGKLIYLGDFIFNTSNTKKTTFRIVDNYKEVSKFIEQKYPKLKRNLKKNLAIEQQGFIGFMKKDETPQVIPLKGEDLVQDIINEIIFQKSKEQKLKK